MKIERQEEGRPPRATRGIAGIFGILGFFLLLVGPEPILAQQRGLSVASVTGVVEDRDRGSGVGTASIRLVRQTEESVPSDQAAEAVTDRNGRFTIGGLVPGAYRLTVQALGYAEMVQELEISGDVHLQVGLVPEAIELDPLVIVTRQSRYLRDVGFYDRRERGRARSTFTRDELRSHPGNRISDFLRTLPGVTVRDAGLSRQAVLFRAGCQPDVVIDGINLGAGVSVDDVAQSSDVEGLEVHRGSTQFLPFSSSACGSVVVWTVDPSAMEDGRPWTWRRFAVAAGFVAGVLLITR